MPPLLRHCRHWHCFHYDIGFSPAFAIVTSIYWLLMPATVIAIRLLVGWLLRHYYAIDYYGYYADYYFISHFHCHILHYAVSAIIILFRHWYCRGYFLVIAIIIMPLVVITVIIITPLLITPPLIEGYFAIATLAAITPLLAIAGYVIKIIPLPLRYFAVISPYYYAIITYATSLFRCFLILLALLRQRRPYFRHYDIITIITPHWLSVIFARLCRSILIIFHYVSHCYCRRWLHYHWFRLSLLALLLALRLLLLRHYHYSCCHYYYYAMTCHYYAIIDYLPFKMPLQLSLLIHIVTSFRHYRHVNIDATPLSLPLHWSLLILLPHCFIAFITPLRHYGYRCSAYYAMILLSSIYFRQNISLLRHTLLPHYTLSLTLVTIISHYHFRHYYCWLSPQYLLRHYCQRHCHYHMALIRHT